MHQFLHRAKWLAHVHGHIDRLKVAEKMGMQATCPHPGPRCPKNFDSILELEFHLQDIHGVDRPKLPKPPMPSRLPTSDSAA